MLVPRHGLAVDRRRDWTGAELPNIRVLLRLNSRCGGFLQYFGQSVYGPVDL